MANFDSLIIVVWSKQEASYRNSSKRGLKERFEGQLSFLALHHFIPFAPSLHFYTVFFKNDAIDKRRGFKEAPQKGSLKKEFEG